MVGSPGCLTPRPVASFGCRRTCLVRYFSLPFPSNPRPKHLLIFLPLRDLFQIVRSPVSTVTESIGLPACDQLEVVKSDGARQSYRIFDHVTVYITIAESTAHSLGLRLELYAKAPKGRKREKNELSRPIAEGDDGFKMRADAEMVEVSLNYLFLRAPVYQPICLSLSCTHTKLNLFIFSRVFGQ